MLTTTRESVTQINILIIIKMSFTEETVYILHVPKITTVSWNMLHCTWKLQVATRQDLYCRIGEYGSNNQTAIKNYNFNAIGLLAICQARQAVRDWLGKQSRLTF